MNTVTAVSSGLANTRKRPPPQRLMRNGAGLLFKKSRRWTPYATEATIFSAVQDALQARNLFGLDAITLVPWPTRYQDPLTIN